MHQDLYQLKEEKLPFLTVNELAIKNKFKKRGLRIAHAVFIDFPMATYLATWQHEAFGHAYRMRELGFKNIKTRVYSPWPYVRNPFQNKYIGGVACGEEPATISDF